VLYSIYSFFRFDDCFCIPILPELQGAVVKKGLQFIEVLAYLDHSVVLDYFS